MENEKNSKKNRGKDISLIGLFGSNTFKEFQKKMAQVTDFSFSIIDYKGTEIVPGYQHPALISYLRRTKEDLSDQMSSAFAAAKAAITNIPYIYLCKSGLVKIAVPIIVNEQYLGAIICGNICCNDISAIDSETGMPIINNDLSIDIRNIHFEDLEEFPVMNAARIKSCSDLIFYVMREICQKESYLLEIGNEEHNQIHLSDLRRKNTELKNRLRHLESKILRSDLYPQTLLNMLITISNMAIIEDASKTHKMAGVFSEILRYYLESDHYHVGLSQELNEVEKYLSVIQLHYESHITVDVNKTSLAANQKIPKLFLLPLAEYLINFGLLERDFRGKVIVNADVISGRCVITFSLKQNEGENISVGYLNDTGRVIDDKAFHEQLTVLNKRLYYEYGDDYRLTVERDEIILNIPMKKNDK